MGTSSRREGGARWPRAAPVSARSQQQTVAAGAGRRREEEGGEAYDGEAYDGEGEEALLEGADAEGEGGAGGDVRDRPRSGPLALFAGPFPLWHLFPRRRGPAGHVDPARPR